ncbi:MAG: CDP-glucose 4,6-dehydratase [Bradyrhizobium sp.]|nr:CDP-glucose 4,6-dehydratase [Bradyrhizobium sp.]
MGLRRCEVESLVIDRAFWRGRRVFLTGHTGFKGAWTTLLLRSLDAEVGGFALPPEHVDGLFTVADVTGDCAHRIGNINDPAALTKAMADFAPDVVIHMAAQALVRRSYAEPVETYLTNVMGTVHVLEAIRQLDSVRAAVIVSSDKCYENTGLARGYHEGDPLGGADPYSSSKAGTELVTASYRRSYFATARGPQIASARAGNVIGGGDWAEDRLVPDAVRAFRNGIPLHIRNPASVRPWQHVLDPVIGYLRLAERLVSVGRPFAEGWNFGPYAASEVRVGEIADHLVRLWGGDAGWSRDNAEHPYEAAYLRLDCTKANTRLDWHPALSLTQSLQMTVEWYKHLAAGASMREISLGQIDLVLATSNMRATS